MRKLLAVACVLQCIYLHAQQPSNTKPNIIFIMSDDHDADAISAYNKQFISTAHIDRIAKEGIRMKNAYVANSICGPARATLLTGQHAHMNGVKDNRTRFDSSKSSMPKILQAAGYQTAVIGKWHLHSYPSGYDFWNILPGQGLYFEPRMISMKGDTSTYHGYATDVITDEAIRWMNTRQSNQPFFLQIHHKAPHRYFFAPLKFIEQFHNKTFPEPATLMLNTAGKGTAWKRQTMSILSDLKLCSDLKVDPSYLMNIPHLAPDSAEIAYYRAIFNRIPEPGRSRIKEIYAERGRILQQFRPKGEDLLRYKYQWYMQDYLACVASIDENVGKILAYLDDHQLTNNTLLVYTSDQGMYLGENGWFDKRFMYEPSMHTPLLMRWPGVIRPGQVNHELVQNIDFAPTILGAAGIHPPNWMQGLDLTPLLAGTQKKLKRETLYYHFYEDRADHTVLKHLGVKNKRYKIVYFYTVNEWELYDLKKDPQELNNLYYSPAHQKKVRLMKKTLNTVRSSYQDTDPAGPFY